MPTNDFLERLIQQLRNPELARVTDGNAERLARALEGRLSRLEPSEFGLHLTGNDDQDRQVMADWLEHVANGPAFTSPSWTRTHSEIFAAMLRHNYTFDKEGFLVAWREYWSARGVRT